LNRSWVEVACQSLANGSREGNPWNAWIVVWLRGQNQKINSDFWPAQLFKSLL
jgi:hypothetical protein